MVFDMRNPICEPNGPHMMVGGATCACGATEVPVILSRQRYDALTAAEAALTASREREAALRAYAMALRGDLVEIDDVGDCGDFDIYRHMHGTLEEDVAALAASSAAVQEGT